MRILLVDDDESIVGVLTRLLREQNYVVDVAKDGESGWELVEGFQYDLVLLDVMLPKLDGISFCRRLRDQKNPVLVMLLTARDTTTDKLVGLDSGADDYVVKPFNVQELAARIRALIRRGSISTNPMLTCGELHLDSNMHEVTYRGQVLQLSRKEYLLVELFLRNQKRVYSCRDIVDHLWSFDAEAPNESTVRSHIKNIRRHLKAVGAADLLETVYGQGYRINPTFISSSHNQMVVSSVKQETLDNSVAEIWHSTKNLAFERLSLIEAAIPSLGLGIFDETLYLQVIQNAHKLAGSLGMFGFDQGSSLARQIEVLFESEFQMRSHFTTLSLQKLARKLEPLVITLRQELGGNIKEVIDIRTTADNSPLFEPINAKILVVDDDPQILLILKTLLEPLGVKLTCLDNPNDFWKTLNLTRPDFVILDVNMPSGTEGLHLCESIRQNHDWNWLPILFLTGCTDVETLQQAFVKGADDYLTKPIVAQELLIRIVNRLQRIRTIRNQI
ncbi:response regulator [Trichormus variabilis]|uniref:Transcriptional regulator n=1 Tax=Trichormus variabilis SAG 1403-4b TaxID=447716 RepID=A0A433USS8_ANAVA|nr:response regulator [Trichormus variabilis]MBD2628174.1 response regulator [Trichormus variabilis FACHB-164]RUS96895.1 transcriptional regulator [Trichormus variabilis SAG 1403-4b]